MQDNNMQQMLQQALQMKGGQGQPQPGGQMTSTATMPQQEPPMMGGDIVMDIQEQLAAIAQALDETRDPAEMQQLMQAGRELQAMLTELQQQGGSGGF